MPEEIKTPVALVRREHFFALLLLGLLYALVTIPPLEQPATPANASEHFGQIRVVLPPLPKFFHGISPYGPGFDDELLQTLSNACGFELVCLHAKSLPAAWEMLAQAKADMLIGSGYEPPAALQNRFAAGPAYLTNTPVIIRGKNVRRLYLSGAVGERWKRLGSNPFLMTANPSLEKRMLDEAPWLDRTMITRVNPRYSLEVILDSLDGGQAAYALVDSGRFRLWRPFFPHLRQEKIFSQPISYRWYWRTERRDLAVALDYFWEAPETKARLKELEERYFGFLPQKTSRVGINHLVDTVLEELPKYRSKILRESMRCGIDPLLYVAMIYQESQFNPKAESRTGAKGLLQFTSAAAEYFHLQDPLDSDESIRAGADYLKLLRDDLEGLGLPYWDHWFFTLAGYNQGKGHLSDAIELAYRLGRSGRTWADLKQMLPKLRKQAYAQNARYGSCRGQEAVRFVDNIRYYYYILRGLISLARPEAKDLGPFAGGPLLALGAVF